MINDDGDIPPENNCLSILCGQLHRKGP
uniref:Uncharacterized protein n=1 Tax=Arundo donax TaxID=35708 RepID=A0A0A9C8U2_ARUDO